MDTVTRRLGLVVATTEYDDQRLARLGAPLADALELARTLSNEGDFEVETLINAEAQTVQRRIERFCKTGKLNSDSLLVYLTGHGIKDDDGNLYFALRDTDRDLLRTTALSADLLAAVMDDSPARSQVLILDCCYSGAYARAMRAKGGDDANLKERFASSPDARGRIVLAASGAIELAWEDERGSIFTRAMVDGIRTGEADLDRDGEITARELHTYVSDVLRAEGRQTPRKFEIDNAGEFVLARQGATSPLSVPAPRLAPPSPRLSPAPNTARRWSRAWTLGIGGVAVAVLVGLWLVRPSPELAVSVPGPSSIDWQLILEETFAENRGGWTEGDVVDESGSSTYRLVGGAYQGSFTVDGADEAYYSIVPYTARSEWIYLETEATALLPDSQCGLAVQTADGPLLIVALGQSRVDSGLYVDGVVTDATTWPIGLRDANETRFGLRIEGTAHTIYIGDDEIATFDEPRLDRIAQVGIGLRGGPEVQCSFDYLVVLEG
jgi:hypothetical protein